MTMLAIAIAALLGTSGPAFAVPQVLQYQGRLTDAAGVALSDPVNVTFSIYSDPKGGTPLWSQTFENLPLDNGRFSVLLGGEGTPFTPELIDQIKAGSDLHLGIQVGPDAEMTPRQQIASVVYGLHAAFADSATFASTSRHAARADTATLVLETRTLHTVTADTSRYALESQHAARAAFADSAAIARNSRQAAFAAESRHATTADTARVFLGAAGRASFADSAALARDSRQAAFALESRHAATADTVTGTPGIAYRSIHRISVPNGTSVSAMSLSITTPIDGYVLVVASGTLVLDNRGTGGVLCHANVGEVLNALPETTMGLAIASVDSTDTRTDHYISFHCQRVFAKAAGTHAFHLNASVRSPNGTASVNRPTMTALFIPKIYGTSAVDPTPQGPGE